MKPSSPTRVESFDMSTTQPPGGPEMPPMVKTSLPFHAQEVMSISLESLIREYYLYIRRLALTILDDGTLGAIDVEAEADDAAQETFLAASRAFPDFRGDASLKTWLTTIAVNQCRGRLRKRKTLHRLKSLISNFQLQITHPPSPEDSALQQDTHHRLWAAVDALDEKHRLPVVLRYVHELPIPEIAATLGLPVGTVHSRLHHARTRLKEELAGSDDFNSSND